MKQRILSLILLFICTLPFASAQIFYRIEGNGLKKPSFLFGTHHLASPKILGELQVLSRIDSVKVVVGEVDLAGLNMGDLMGAMGSEIMQYAIVPEDSTLSKILSPEDYDLVKEAFKKNGPFPGADLKLYDRICPLIISTMLNTDLSEKMTAGYDPENQLDIVIMRTGKERGKKIVGLETMDYQLNLLFKSLPISVQAEALLNSVKEPDNALRQLDILNEAYTAGDLDKLMELADEEGISNSSFMNQFLEKRNADWLEKIPSILKSGPALIAVGALHLAGEDGLVNGLRKMGYTVTPITN